METGGKERPATGGLKTARRRAVRYTPETLVKVGQLPSGQALPPLLEPNLTGFEAASWAASNRDFISAQLHQRGALLFRNFELGALAGFEGFVRAICPKLMDYGERSSPRSRLSDGLYTSTDHPAEQPIMLHNEQSYTLNWPMKIWFFCLQPAAWGGGTPIADSRKILARLPARVVEEFKRRQVMYVRNYSSGLGLPWQEVFQTSDRAVVERYCHREGIEAEWREGGERLLTRQVRPAVREHPHTGESVWFNHSMFFHLSSLDSSVRAAMLSVVEEEEVPFNTFYGDGAAIEASVMDDIRDAYEHEQVSFGWRQGDVLMVDNMLVAHGREPYRGDRKVVVAMAEPYSEAAA